MHACDLCAPMADYCPRLSRLPLALAPFASLEVFAHASLEGLSTKAAQTDTHHKIPNARTSNKVCLLSDWYEEVIGACAGSAT